MHPNYQIIRILCCPCILTKYSHKFATNHNSHDNQITIITTIIATAIISTGHNNHVFQPQFTTWSTASFFSYWVNLVPEKNKISHFRVWRHFRILLPIYSVTRFGNLSPFWRFLEPFGDNFFCQNRQKNFIKALMHSIYIVQ